MPGCKICGRLRGAQSKARLSIQDQNRMAWTPVFGGACGENRRMPGPIVLRSVQQPLHITPVRIACAECKKSKRREVTIVCQSISSSVRRASVRVQSASRETQVRASRPLRTQVPKRAPPSRNESGRSQSSIRQQSQHGPCHVALRYPPDIDLLTICSGIVHHPGSLAGPIRTTPEVNAVRSRHIMPGR